MSEKVQIEKSKEMQELEAKMTMLIQTGRMDNLIDLMAVVSDNIEMTTQPMVEKMISTVDNIATAVVEVEGGSLKKFHGGYSSYLEQKQQLLENMQKDHQNLQCYFLKLYLRKD
mgnify:CR=1 FL=1